MTVALIMGGILDQTLSTVFVEETEINGFTDEHRLGLYKESVCPRSKRICLRFSLFLSSYILVEYLHFSLNAIVFKFKLLQCV